MKIDSIYDKDSYLIREKPEVKGNLATPNFNPYSRIPEPKSGKISNPSSTRGLSAAERNNNPFNIKYGNFAAKYGATKENRNALDGGSFATFDSPETGLKAGRDLLLGKGYRNLSVDGAMKRWSNSGYGGNIYPEIANKRIGDLSEVELKALQRKQLVQEDRNYAKKLGFLKFGGNIGPGDKVNNGNKGNWLNRVIANNVYPYGGLGTSQSSYRIDNNVQIKLSKNYKDGKISFKEYNKQLKKNSLNAKKESADFIGQPSNLNASYDALNLHQGVDQKYNSFNYSKYKPSQSKEDVKYFALQGDAQKEVLNEIQSNKDFLDNPRENKRLIKGSLAGQGALKNYTISKGKDAKGTYVSYYDRNDYDNILDVVPNAKPFEIYDRFYMDVKYDDSPVLPFDPLKKNVKVPFTKTEKKKMGGLLKFGQGGFNQGVKDYGQIAGMLDNGKNPIISGALQGISQGSSFGIAGAAIGGALGLVNGIKENQVAKQLKKTQLEQQQMLMLQNNQYDLQPNNSPTFFDKGGEIEAEYEVEKNEVVQGNAKLSDSKKIADGLHLVLGYKHGQNNPKTGGEGVYGNGGERVFSDSIAFKKKTVANEALRLGKMLNKYQDKKSQNNKIASDTGKVMEARLNKELDALFDYQEAMKMPKLKFGGEIPGIKKPQSSSTRVAKPKEKDISNEPIEFSPSKVRALTGKNIYFKDDVYDMTTKTVARDEALEEKYTSKTLNDEFLVQDLKYNKRHNQKVNKVMLADIVKASKNAGVDPYDAISVAQRESGLGHSAYNNRSYIPSQVFSNREKSNYELKDAERRQVYDVSPDEPIPNKFYEQIKKKNNLYMSYPFAGEMDSLKRLGVKGYNPGDKDYSNKVNKEKEILLNNKNIKAFVDSVYTNSPKLKFGGLIKLQQGGETPRQKQIRLIKENLKNNPNQTESYKAKLRQKIESLSNDSETIPNTYKEPKSNIKPSYLDRIRKNITEYINPEEYIQDAWNGKNPINRLNDNARNIEDAVRNRESTNLRTTLNKFYNNPNKQRQQSVVDSSDYKVIDNTPDKVVKPLGGKKGEVYSSKPAKAFTDLQNQTSAYNNRGVKANNITQKPISSVNPLATKLTDRLAKVDPTKINGSIGTVKNKNGFSKDTLGILSNFAANNAIINRMNPNVAALGTNAPRYDYRDASGLARHNFNSVYNSLSNGVNAGQKQAIFANIMNSTNQVNDQEANRKMEYDNRYNYMKYTNDAQNTNVLNTAINQGTANQNAILGLRSDNMNNLYQNLNMKETEKNYLRALKIKGITGANKIQDYENQK